MDHAMQPTDARVSEAGVRSLSRRAFLGWARAGLIAATGVFVLGAIAPTSAFGAKESADEDKKETKDKKDAKDTKDDAADKANRKKKRNKNKGQVAAGSSTLSRFIVPGQDRYNCSDFTSQTDAQGVLRLAPQDPNNLDRNRDGIACGGVEAAQDGVPGGFMMPPYDINPVPRP